MLTVLFVITRALTGESLTLGSGYEVIRWLGGGTRAVVARVRCSLIRCLATAMTLGRWRRRRAVHPARGRRRPRRSTSSADFVNPLDPTLYVLLGIAAFLGAGYRVPLAAVMFVAETTGQPGFIVPALFAAVAAELVMGEQSITTFQRSPETDADRRSASFESMPHRALS